MRGIIVGTAIVAGLAVAPGVAAAPSDSLPDGRFGQRPGPPLLYRDPPTAPQLSVTAPFRAKPLLVSGTDAYRDGEYLYQDYLFDDHGADTDVPDTVTAERKPGPGDFSTSSGDVLYPTGDGYRHNAADLMELRARPSDGGVVYRATLTTVVADSDPAIGFGIDTDGGGGDPPLVPWANGADLRSPGLDLFVTAHGGGGEVRRYGEGGSVDLPDGAVALDRRTNQLTIRLPERFADPNRATWRHYAGVGLWDGANERFKPVPPSAEPTEESPASGNPAQDAPAIFNLAFRFDEPQTNQPQLPDPFDDPLPSTGPGTGNWFESEQASTLAGREVRRQHADIDFGALAQGDRESIHGPGREQARIFASGMDQPEGVREGFPEFGGRVQPYLLTVPRGYRTGEDRPAGLTFSLHSLGGTYTQYAVFSPHQLDQFGPQRGNLVATPLGRGPDGWYTGPAEVDMFEVWRDVANRFELDPRRAYTSGYSMGGYGTYKQGAQYPDLFARAFTTVGPPGEGIWLPPAPPQPGGEVTNTNNLLENVRWLPYMNWVAQQDQLVPYPGPTAQQNRFDALRLRSTLETFQGDHFTLAIADEWGAARDFLGDHRTERRPSRVNYAFMPEADRPRLGLVHNHAYWVSRLRARDESGDPQTNPARGKIKAVSEAFGQGRAQTEPVVAAGTEGRPAPSTIRGTRWTGFTNRPERNRLRLRLSNVAHARVDGVAAKLSDERALQVWIASDGTGEVRLDVPLAADVEVRRFHGGPAPEVTLDRRGATFHVGDRRREYVISDALSGRPGN